jgi:hypothetical protein
MSQTDRPNSVIVDSLGLVDDHDRSRQCDQRDDSR